MPGALSASRTTTSRPRHRQGPGDRKSDHPRAHDRDIHPFELCHARPRVNVPGRAPRPNCLVLSGSTGGPVRTARFQTHLTVTDVQQAGTRRSSR